MSIFEQVATALTEPVAMPAPRLKTMQNVFEDAIDAGKKDEANAIARVEGYLAVPLSATDADLGWFDKTFPKVKTAQQVPGRERSFWKNREAYNRWRRKVRRRIEHTIGEVAAKEERKARQDGWAGLLAILNTLCHEGGLVHAGELGAVKSLADRARKAGLEPSGLDRDALAGLLDAAPSSAIRSKILRAAKVLQRYQVIRSVSVHLPEKIEIDAARRRFELTLPAHVEEWIEALVENASRDPESYDEITGHHTRQNKPSTISTTRSAMRNYVWTASSERSDAFDLDNRDDLEALFAKDVFYRVIAFWIDISDEPGALTARSANAYVGDVMTVCKRNGIAVKHMKQARKTNAFLLEGKEAEETMSPKNIAFCRPIVENVGKRSQFLSQHIRYRERAEALLATDKVLAGERLTKIRALGACAAFAAIELAGAPLREINVLQLRHRGPTSNLFLPVAQSPFYRIVMSPDEMKVQKKEEPQIKIRRNRLEGAQTLDWYLKHIRPLFPFGNPDWCATPEDEPFDHIRFGLKKNGQVLRESIHLFPSVESNRHLPKSTFYNWIVTASEEIGMPMTPHNFRHGVASILLSRSFANLPKVANLLGNKPAAIQTYYAWIDKEALMDQAQDEILAEVAAG